MNQRLEGSIISSENSAVCYFRSLRGEPGGFAPQADIKWANATIGLIIISIFGGQRMQFDIVQGSIIEHPCDVLVVNLFEEVKTPGGGTGAVDKALGGAISELIREEEFEGALGKTAVLRTCGAIPAKKIVLVGLGKSEEFGIREILKASGSAVRKCQSLRAKRVATIMHWGRDRRNRRLRQREGCCIGSDARSL